MVDLAGAEVGTDSSYQAGILEGRYRSTPAVYSRTKKRCPDEPSRGTPLKLWPRKLVFVVLQANFQLLDRFVDRVHRVNAMTAEVVGSMLEVFT